MENLDKKEITRLRSKKCYLKYKIKGRKIKLFEAGLTVQEIDKRLKIYYKQIEEVDILIDNIKFKKEIVEMSEEEIKEEKQINNELEQLKILLDEIREAKMKDEKTKKEELANIDEKFKMLKLEIEQRKNEDEKCSLPKNVARNFLFAK